MSKLVSLKDNVEGAKLNDVEVQYLKEIAAKLPVIKVESVEKHRLKGSEILEWETITEIDGKPIDPEQFYMWNYPVITEMNHYRRLKKCWMGTDPTRRVMEYMKYIEDIVEKNEQTKTT